MYLLITGLLLHIPINWIAIRFQTHNQDAMFHLQSITIHVTFANGLIKSTRILKALPIAMKSLHHDCFRLHRLLLPPTLVQVFWPNSGRCPLCCSWVDRHQEDWTMNPIETSDKQLKPNHTIYSYKIFTSIAKKSRRGGIVLMSGASTVPNNKRPIRAVRL